jgi:hypothetical protein
MLYGDGAGGCPLSCPLSFLSMYLLEGADEEIRTARKRVRTATRHTAYHTGRQRTRNISPPNHPHHHPPPTTTPTTTMPPQQHCIFVEGLCI